MYLPNRVLMFFNGQCHGVAVPNTFLTLSNFRYLLTGSLGHQISESRELFGLEKPNRANIID